MELQKKEIKEVNEAEDSPHMDVGLGFLIGFCVTIGVTAIVGGVVAVVLAELRADPTIAADGNATATIDNGQEGVGNLTARLGLIGTLLGFLVVLAAVYLYRKFA